MEWWTILLLLYAIGATVACCILVFLLIQLKKRMRAMLQKTAVAPAPAPAPAPALPPVLFGEEKAVDVESGVSTVQMASTISPRIQNDSRERRADDDVEGGHVVPLEMAEQELQKRLEPQMHTVQIVNETTNDGGRVSGGSSKSGSPLAPRTYERDVREHLDRMSSFSSGSSVSFHDAVEHNAPPPMTTFKSISIIGDPDHTSVSSTEDSDSRKKLKRQAPLRPESPPKLLVSPPSNASIHEDNDEIKDNNQVLRNRSSSSGSATSSESTMSVEEASYDLDNPRALNVINEHFEKEEDKSDDERRREESIDNDEKEPKKMIPLSYQRTIEYSSDSENDDDTKALKMSRENIAYIDQTESEEETRRELRRQTSSESSLKSFEILVDPSKLVYDTGLTVREQETLESNTPLNPPGVEVKRDEYEPNDVVEKEPPKDVEISVQGGPKVLEIDPIVEEKLLRGSSSSDEETTLIEKPDYAVVIKPNSALVPVQTKEEDVNKSSRGSSSSSTMSDDDRMEEVDLEPKMMQPVKSSSSSSEDEQDRPVFIVEHDRKAKGEGNFDTGTSSSSSEDEAPIRECLQQVPVVKIVIDPPFMQRITSSSSDEEPDSVIAAAPVPTDEMANEQQVEIEHGKMEPAKLHRVHTSSSSSSDEEQTNVNEIIIGHQGPEVTEVITPMKKVDTSSSSDDDEESASGKSKTSDDDKTNKNENNEVDISIEPTKLEHSKSKSSSSDEEEDETDREPEVTKITETVQLERAVSSSSSDEESDSIKPYDEAEETSKNETTKTEADKIVPIKMEEIKSSSSSSSSSDTCSSSSDEDEAHGQSGIDQQEPMKTTELVEIKQIDKSSSDDGPNTKTLGKEIHKDIAAKPEKEIPAELKRASSTSSSSSSDEEQAPAINEPILALKTYEEPQVGVVNELIKLQRADSVSSSSDEDLKQATNEEPIIAVERKDEVGSEPSVAKEMEYVQVDDATSTSSSSSDEDEEKMTKKAPEIETENPNQEEKTIQEEVANQIDQKTQAPSLEDDSKSKVSVEAESSSDEELSLDELPEDWTASLAKESSTNANSMARSTVYDTDTSSFVYENGCKSRKDSSSSDSSSSSVISVRDQGTMTPASHSTPKKLMSERDGDSDESVPEDSGFEATITSPMPNTSNETRVLRSPSISSASTHSEEFLVKEPNGDGSKHAYMRLVPLKSYERLPVKFEPYLFIKRNRTRDKAVQTNNQF